MKRYRLRLLTYTISAILTLWITGCGNTPRFHTVQGAVWNTTYNIKYNGDRNLDDSIMGVMNSIELSLSPFNHNSLIAKINDNTSMDADSNIIKVMEISQTVNRLSDKAFDPTVSPLVNLWGFGYNGHEAKVPTDNDIAYALTLVGIDSCHIDRGMTMHKKSPETTFNFSAVTKGYACDEIGRMLRRNGSTDYMIEIGGELTLGGTNDKGVPWRIM
ncbi:MAG: FAD:protein FMN transferase, partial [Muribaculaceae bacterium]|nr:FAD:protein FMN transferase [Muribaculaceae bacterium]